MLSVDTKIVPTIKEMVVSICKEGGGYSNSWPDLMTVIIYYKYYPAILVNPSK